MKHDLVCELRHVGMSSVAEVGGKAAALGEMLAAGLPVPSGFVVTAAAFKAFLSETEVFALIERQLRTIVMTEADSFERASASICELIRNAALSATLQAQIHDAFERLGASSVAVRSSAAAEDSETASWAGQFESVLSVRTSGLLDAIKTCWTSAIQPRALMYRAEQGLLHDWANMAVIVQEMIESERSGVAFSAHPVTKRLDQLLIEAVPGLGDKLVSGEVTPDAYVIDRASSALVHQRLVGAIPVLSEHERQSLTALVLKAEALFGYPVDCEWVSKHGQVLIVQCRPITTLEQTDVARVYESDESIIHDEGLICLGSRPTDFFGAQRRANGWTHSLRDELGIGYSALLVNSLGEMYVKPEEDERIRIELRQAGLVVGLECLRRMQQLRDRLLCLPTDPQNAEVCLGLERMFAYFFVAREILETRFHQATVAEQEEILAWRETDPIYDVIDRLPLLGTEPPVWTIVASMGRVKVFPRLLTGEQEPVSGSMDVLTGQTAYPGHAIGRVRLLRSANDLAEVQQGEILVTTMTLPDYYSALHRAAAYVTDEGGVTSHAAITARELKKPCVIATKVATKILKTGDLVEVDAERGVVRRLK